MRALFLPSDHSYPPSVMQSPAQSQQTEKARVGGSMGDVVSQSLSRPAADRVAEDKKMSIRRRGRPGLKRVNWRMRWEESQQ